MKQTELNKILELHKKYLNGEGGERANLYGADLYDADLRGADLEKTKGYRRDVCQEEGSFTCYKKSEVNNMEYIITLRVPSKAKRVGAIGSRKFRVSEAKVLKIEDMEGVLCNDVIPTGKTYDGISYKFKSLVKPDKFDDSDREECSNGIHAFITKQEAKEY